MATLFRNAVAMCAPHFYKVAYKINPWMGGTVDSQLAHKQVRTYSWLFSQKFGSPSSFSGTR